MMRSTCIMWGNCAADLSVPHPEPPWSAAQPCPKPRSPCGTCATQSLNRIQSRIFPTAFGSNENLLVCAPTGAGKTNIAMIAVLREVGSLQLQEPLGSGLFCRLHCGHSSCGRWVGCHGGASGHRTFPFRLHRGYSPCGRCLCCGVRIHRNTSSIQAESQALL